jgi:hypothetical protein
MYYCCCIVLVQCISEGNAVHKMSMKIKLIEGGTRDDKKKLYNIVLFMMK